MCVAFFTLEHPDYALILCSNRDEYLSRPTQPASFHAPDVLSGIDVEAGGTWLGLTRTGKLALLTNITEPSSTAFPVSRGHLVSTFLASSSHVLEPPRDARYAGFSLLLLAPPRPLPDPLAFDALFVTNHGGGGPVTHRPLSDTQRRLGALSNGIDGHDADEWPKVQHGAHAFRDLLDALPPNTSDDQLIERLFDLLTWRSAQPPRDRSELRNTIQVEPIRIGSQFYATRTSTVVLVTRTGHVAFVERDRWTLAAHGSPVLADPASQRVFHFRLDDSQGSSSQ